MGGFENDVLLWIDEGQHGQPGQCDEGNETGISEG